jgi:diguanylate cyclase (GGDEF)-like protein|tara:strand:+ start:2145 stop:3899 length:1755 start_codon:yes stop_codon:yes gene_type:complete
MTNFKTFTKVLALFCFFVFIYILIPDSFKLFKEILSYCIIIILIITLMIYNDLIGLLSSQKSKESKTDDVDLSVSTIQNKNSDTYELYEELKSLVYDITRSINVKSKSAIYIIDPLKKVFQIQTGKKNEFIDIVKMNNSVILNHINENKKLHQKDYPDVWNKLFSDQNWRGSECAIFSPINIQGAVAGFIVSRVNHFTDIEEKEIQILNKIGDFVSFGLDNITSLEKKILSEKSKSLILEVISDLDFKVDSQNIFNQFKFLIRTFFRYDKLTISLRKETENRRKVDKGINSIIKLVDGEKDEFNEGSEFPTNGSIHGLPTISSRAINSINWKESYPNMARYKSSESNDSPFYSVLGAPIIIEGESRGAILLERKNQELFSANDTRDLELIGNVLGSALHWRHEYEKIHNNATHDGLSGLLNHQTFKERFNDEIQRAARFQQKMAIMIFDLDKFKKVNDTLGHQYGDYVIQTVSKIMQDNVRSVDVVARYGGEEFAVILINSDVEMSTIVAQRIVDNIADFNFLMDGVDARVTISGGMSEYPKHSENTKDLIEFADQAMYATKQKGGNGIITHGNEVESHDKKNI